MFSSSSFPAMPSTASQFFTAYASVTGTIMLVRSMANELIPSPVRSYLQSKFKNWFYTLKPSPSTLTLVIDKNAGFTRNQIYDAAETYLCTKINPSAERLSVSKTPRQKQITVGFEKGVEISDEFDGVEVKWRFVHSEGKQNSPNPREKDFFELTFDKKFRQKILYSYLPWVLDKSKEIKEGEKVVKLYTRSGGAPNEDGGRHGGGWGSINLEHPATFDTLAMDPKMKKDIIEDLERFVRRKDFYKKVGKAWKRGYLLYGPPGTGKSSLIAAIANHLKFDIYDLELTSLFSNADLRRVLLSTTNKSVLVIEDIDCSAEVSDRQQQLGRPPKSTYTKLTLSGLLNFIDGLWSSCGDERIIVFTTNHKDRLDPALLRPGRMDMHIHMSYCTPPGFKLLASNYLGIDDGGHRLFGEIDNLIENTEVTPAEIAEELMKSDDGDVALGGLVSFLKRKSMECDEPKEEENGDKIEPVELKRRRIDSKKNANIIANLQESSSSEEK